MIEFVFSQLIIPSAIEMRTALLSVFGLATAVFKR
jgi:hypothetical protein